MSETIEPALTPEQWAEARVKFPRPERYSDWVEGGYYIGTEGDFAGELVFELEVEGCDRDTPLDRRHALAALALVGQPFGFTWEDVDRLRYAARGTIEYCDRLMPDDSGGCCGNSADSAALASLADRIAALLPPREP